MSTEAAKVFHDAMKLSDAERADLAACLFASLEPEKFDRVDQEWGDEIARRLHAIDTGVAKLIPWDEARRRIFRDSTHSAGGEACEK